MVYPKLKDNLRRQKGKLYFDNWEVTGSDDGSKKSPKFSMLRYWQKQLMPTLVDFARYLRRRNNREIVIRYQWDNMTPHVDGKLTTYLEMEFGRQGWFLAP